MNLCPEGILSKSSQATKPNVLQQNPARVAEAERLKRCPRADPNFAEIEGLRRGDQAKANTNRRFPVGFQGPFIAPAGHENDARSRQVGVRFYTPWMRSKKQTVMLSTVLDLADIRRPTAWRPL